MHAIFSLAMRRLRKKRMIGRTSNVLRKAIFHSGNSADEAANTAAIVSFSEACHRRTSDHFSSTLHTLVHIVQSLYQANMNIACGSRKTENNSMRGKENVQAFRFIFSGAVLERCDFAGGERQAEKRSNSRKFSVKWRCAFNMIRISWFSCRYVNFTALNKLIIHRNVVSQLITICPSTHQDIFQVIKLHSNVIPKWIFHRNSSPLSAFSLHFL